MVEKLPPMESVRARPHMYIGDLGTAGAFHLLLELVANGIDQFLAGKARTLRIRHRNLKIEVFDDGAGFPVTNPELLKTLVQPHDSATADGHASHIHLSPRGVGLFVVNALSRSFRLETAYDGVAHLLVYESGILKSRSDGQSIENPGGTRVIAELDPEVFEVNRLDENQVRRWIFDASHLFPGLAFELNGERFQSTGLLALAEFYRPIATTRELVEAHPRSYRRFQFIGASKKLRLNVAFSGELKSAARVKSWVNGISTAENGTHVSGVLRAAAETDWLPETVLVSVILSEPGYAGPTKDRLSTSWVSEEVYSLLKEPLAKFLAESRY